MEKYICGGANSIFTSKDAKGVDTSRIIDYKITHRCRLFLLDNVIIILYDICCDYFQKYQQLFVVFSSHKSQQLHFLCQKKKKEGKIEGV